MASGLLELAAAPRSSPAAPGPARFDGCGQSAARREFAADHTPFRPSGLDDIAQDAVHRILVEDAQVAIRQQVHLQSLQLQTQFSRLVVNGERAVVGQTGLRTYRGIFREACGDIVCRLLLEKKKITTKRHIETQKEEEGL